ncbi:hypothetical protein ACFWR6_19565 [Streptomyces griseus]|uniref:hypothetical protein n=1 Tax=Streptomyces griseus TaxID=1911 RepID=UPI003657E3DD
MDTHDAGAAGRAAAAELARSFNAAADRAMSPDSTPLDRAAMITGLLKAVEGRQKELAAARRADMHVVRPTMTLAAIGAAVDLSTGRVDQILKGK